MEPEAEIIRAQLFTLRDEAYRTFQDVYKRQLHTTRNSMKMPTRMTKA